MSVKINGTTGITTPNIDSGSYNQGQLAGFRNKIINGGMNIVQRGSVFTAGPGATNGFCQDRWVSATTAGTTGVFTTSGPSDAPTSAPEFTTSLRATVNTADTSLASSDLYVIQQRIEGYNVRDLIGRAFTLSFWVRSSKVGIHCISLGNNIDRSYVVEYTINSANTWEHKTITVAGGLITAGTWNWTNGAGLVVSFALAVGSGFQGAAGSWITSGYAYSTANQVNCLDTVGNIFAITGVQLEAGTTATPFEHRPYGIELALCQRYYEKGESTLYILNITDPYIPVRFIVPKRAAPTVTRTDGGPITGSTSGTLISPTALNEYGFYFYRPGVSIAVGGNWTASAEL